MTQPPIKNISGRDMMITQEMIIAGAKACSQWRNGKKMPFPTFDDLGIIEQQEYAAQALACLIAALKDNSLENKV